MDHLRREGHRGDKVAGLVSALVGAAYMLDGEEYRFLTLHYDTACAVDGEVFKDILSLVAEDRGDLALRSGAVVGGAVVAGEFYVEVVVYEYQRGDADLRENGPVEVYIRVVGVEAGHIVPRFVRIGPVARYRRERAHLPVQGHRGSGEVSGHTLSVSLFR